MSLYLIPTLLSENAGVLSSQLVEVVRSLDEFIVENEKTARQFLKKIETNFKQNELIFHLLNEHSSDIDISDLTDVIKKEKDIGLLSEAGCPAVADPGASIVRIAHENNIRVIPLTGPSSILLALMSSGMNGQSFVFHGYLPRDPNQRKIKIAIIEKDAVKKNQTQIFIETPYRNMQLLTDLLQVCSGETLLCVACNLTSENEMVKTMPVSEWKKNLPEINKLPVIFLIGN